MQGVLQQAVSLVSAPLSQAARLFAALEQAAGENTSLLAPSPAASAEPTNEELAAEVAQAPTTEAAAELTQEPTNEELAAEAASAGRSVSCT